MFKCLYNTTIIKQNSADSYSVVQTLQTVFSAKTMALDKATHKIYLSAPKFDMTGGKRKVIPGTFTAYVYKMNGYRLAVHYKDANK